MVSYISKLKSKPINASGLKIRNPGTTNNKQPTRLLSYSQSIVLLCFPSLLYESFLLSRVFFSTTGAETIEPPNAKLES